MKRNSAQIFQQFASRGGKGWVALGVGVVVAAVDDTEARESNVCTYAMTDRSVCCAAGVRVRLAGGNHDAQPQAGYSHAGRGGANGGVLLLQPSGE